MNHYFYGICCRFVNSDGLIDDISKFCNVCRGAYEPIDMSRHMNFLCCNRTDKSLECVAECDMETAKKLLKSIHTLYPQATYKTILYPDEGWHIVASEDVKDTKGTKEVQYTYLMWKTEDRNRLVLQATRELLALTPVSISELPEVMALYNHAKKREGCVWTESYPNEEILTEDIRNNDLFAIRDPENRIIAAVAKDRDAEVDALAQWDPKLSPGAELARLVVDDKYCDQGMARILLRQGMKLLKERGFGSIHFLVAKDNERAIRSYRALAFVCKGEVYMFDHDYDCYEKAL